MPETDPLRDVLYFIKLEAEAAEHFCSHANSTLDARLKALRDQWIKDDVAPLRREELTIYAEYDIRALQNLNRAVTVGVMFSLFERVLWCLARDAQDRGISDPILSPNKIWDLRGYANLLRDFGVDVTDLPPELRRMGAIRNELSSFIYAEGQGLRLEDSFVQDARELVMRTCEAVRHAYSTFLHTRDQAA